jgi:hypothetical protein
MITIARHEPLRAKEPESGSSPCEQIQPQGRRRRLFLVHGVGGGLMWGYANLAGHLGTDQPVYAFKPCDSARLDEFDTIEKMAAY